MMIIIEVEEVTLKNTLENHTDAIHRNPRVVKKKVEKKEKEKKEVNKEQKIRKLQGKEEILLTQMMTTMNSSDQPRINLDLIILKIIIRIMMIIIIIIENRQLPKVSQLAFNKNLFLPHIIPLLLPFQTMQPQLLP